METSIVLWTHDAPAASSGPRPNARPNHVATILSDVRFWQTGLVMGMGAVGAFRGLWAGPYPYDLLRIGNIVVGDLLLLMGVGSIVGFLVAGWLCNRWGRGPVTLFFGLHAVSGMPALALRLPLLAVALVYVVLGLSSGMGVPLVAHARALFPATMTGQVLSLLNFCGFAGTFLLQWGMGLVISHFPTDTAGHQPATALSYPLICRVCVMPAGRATKYRFAMALPLPLPSIRVWF
jgi:predicted MFS family arabinose efflux permease